MSNSNNRHLCAHAVRRCLSRWPELERILVESALRPTGTGRFYGGATHPLWFDTGWYRPIGVRSFHLCPGLPENFAAVGVVNNRRNECVFVVRRIEERWFWYLAESATFSRVTPQTPVEVVARQLHAAIRRWTVGYNLVAVSGLVGGWFNPNTGRFDPDPELCPTG